MKNLPETDMWKKLKSRLAQYEEEPGDDFAAILKGTQAASETNRDATTKSLWVILILLLGWLGVPDDLASESLSFEAAHLSSNVLQSLAGESSANDRALHSEPGDVSDAAVPNAPRVSADASQRAESNRNQLKNSQFNRTEILLSGDNAVASGDDGMKNTSSVKDKPSADVITAFLFTGVADTARVDTPGSSVVNVLSVDAVPVKTSEKKSQQETKRKKSVLMYFSATPSFSYYNIRPNKQDQITVKDLRSPGIFSFDRFGFSLEGGIYYPLTPRLEWYGGVMYQHLRQSFTFTCLSDEGVVISPGDDGYTVTPAESIKRVRYNARNLGLSSGLLYTVKQHRLVHQLGAGLQVQYGKSYLHSEGSTSGDTMSHLDYQFLYRLRWKFSRRMDFYLQPSYTGSFQAQENLGQPFAIKASRAGIGFGVIYRLR